MLCSACPEVVPVRAFLKRVIDLTCAVKNPHHYIRLTCEARAGQHTWYSSICNQKFALLHSHWLFSDNLTYLLILQGHQVLLLFWGINNLRTPSNIINQQSRISKILFQLLRYGEINCLTELTKYFNLFISENMAADNVFKEQTSFDYLTPTAQKI